MIRFFINIFCKVLFATMALSLSPSNVGAQSTQMTIYSTSQGLPSPEVYKVFKCSRNYLWFLTDKGIAKYDGTEFKIFNKSNSGLSSDVMFSIAEDSNARIWFSGLDGSIVIYDRSKDSIQIVAKTNHFRTNLIIQFIRPQKNDIKFFPVKSDRCQPISFSHNSGEFSFLDEVKIRNVKFVNQGMTSLEFNRNRYQILGRTSKQGQGQEIITGLNSVEFTFLGNNLYRSTDGETFNSVLSCDGKINQLKIIDSFLFVSSYKGLYKYDLANDSLIRISELYNFTSVDIDYDGFLWASTLNNGAIKFVADRTSNLEIKDDLRKDNASIIKINRHKNSWLTVSKNGQIFKIDQNLNQSLLYACDDIQNIPSLGLNSHDSMMFIIDGSQSKKINIETYASENIHTTVKEGVDSFLTKVGLSSHCFPFATDSIFSPYQNRGGFCLFVYDSSQGKHRLVYRVNEPNLGKVFKVERFRNYLLIGTSSGLWAFGKNDFSLQYVYVLKDPSTDVEVVDISSNDSLIFIATKRSGLFYSNSLDNWSKTGLVKDNKLILSGLSNIDNNSIWVSTNDGAFKIDIEIEEGKMFLSNTYSLNQNNGLNSNYVYDVETNENYVLLSHDKGMEYFNTNLTEIENNPPLIDLKAKVNSNYILSGAVIPHDQNGILIELEAISYNKPINKFFRYKLEPSDSNFWIYTDESNLYFSNLKSGQYNFKFQARNLHNNWSNIKNISFTIEKPFKETLLFKILLVLSPFIALFVGYLLYILVFRRFVVRASKYNVLLEKFKSLKLSGLNAQMNPHFVFNAMNSIQSFIYSNDFNQGDTYMKSFGGILRQTLNMNRKLWVNLSDEVDLINDYLRLESGSRGDRFSYRVTTEFSEDFSIVRIPPFFIQPLVENCIQHGFDSRSSANKIEVEISFFQNEEKINGVKIKVIDNGKGFKKTNIESSSLALQIIRDKLFLLNEKFNTNIGGLTVQNRKDVSGVVAIVTVPYDLENEDPVEIDWKY